MKLSGAWLGSILALACSRAQAPAPSLSPSAPSATAASATAQRLSSSVRGVSSFELSGEIVALAAARAPSAEFPLGTVMLGLAAPTAQLAEWDLARGRVVRSAAWPDAVPMGEASFGLAKSGDGWITVVSGDDTFSEPSRVTRLSGDLGRREWSHALEPGVYPSVAADEDTVAVSEQRPGRVLVASFDARTGGTLASRNFREPAAVLTRVRPLADVVVAHGFVYASLPASDSALVVRLSPKLAPRGALSFPQDTLRAKAGYTPRIAPSAHGLLVLHFEPSFVLELDAALARKQRWDVALHDDDAVVATLGGFVSAFGRQASGSLRFRFERPDSWRGSDEGVFERRLIVVAHGRVVTSVSAARHAALLLVDP